MKLYHFTALYYLPQILTDGGLRRGHIPTLPIDEEQQVVNLTRTGERHKQHWYSDFPNEYDKTRVRISVDVPVDKLKSWKAVQKEFSIRSKDMKSIDPHYDRPNWFYAFDGVHVEHFENVEVWQNGEWWHLSLENLQKLAEFIQEEISSRIIEVNGQIAFDAEGSFLSDGTNIENPILLEFPTE